MPRFPFYDFLNPYYKNYGYYPNYNQNKFRNHVFPTITNGNHISSEHLQIDKENLTEDSFFEIMGLKLYLDDILLISLLFFLYNEGVQDESLFIALVLLLLT